MLLELIVPYRLFRAEPRPFTMRPCTTLQLDSPRGTAVAWPMEDSVHRPGTSLLTNVRSQDGDQWSSLH